MWASTARGLCAAPKTIADAKLCAEIRQLNADSEQKTGWRSNVSSIAGLAGVLGAIGAVVGVLLTFRAQRLEQADQRTRDRQQREDASQRLLDEQFRETLTNLGSESLAVQASAAVSLLGFLNARHLHDGTRSAYNRRVRLATLANLKVAHEMEIKKLLTRVFEAAVRTPEPLEPVEKDLSHAALRRADLSSLDLTEADVAFADLGGANLTNTKLFRARGIEVELGNARMSGDAADLREVRFRGAKAERADFREANLRAAHLEQAVLNGARFQKTRLQSAHLDGAELVGALFHQADLNDAYFVDAELDEVTLRSITRALNWEKAHFSPDDARHLEELVGGS